MRRTLVVLALAAAILGAEAEAAEAVDLELVLLADASRSIDDAEVRFQRRHYAAAITDPDVLAAIASGYRQRIVVTYVEWGDVDSQEIVVPWTFIDGPETASVFARALIETPRLGFGPNAIGNALAVAHGLILGNGIGGARKIIDFSGDSASNFGGIPIADARAAALADDIVINGLAILCHTCTGRPVGYDLEAAFADFIIGGRGSFVVTADGADQFARAVRRKLLLEIAGVPGAGARKGSD
jgi:hypothetical protein